MQSAEQPTTPSAPQGPQETGTRLATIPRGENEELRVTWDEYRGCPYIGIRMWRRSQDGSFWWPDKARGLTVRLRELGDFAEATRRAQERAGEHQAGDEVPF